MDQIYVLELEEGKYYVGKTKNSDLRMGQHFDGDGSTWTKKYKPTKVIDVKSCFTVFDEENTTIAYMKEKGIYNVRGGSYCNVELTDNEVNIINKLILSIENKCYKCGGNHYAKECKFQQKPKETTIKSLSVIELNPDYEIITITQETYEHQRWYPFIEWSPNLLPTDRPQFSSKDGKTELRKESFISQPNQKIIKDWSVDLEGCANTEGWYYAFVFQDPVYNLTCESDNFVRRRKWIRIVRSIVPKHTQYDGKISNSSDQKNNNTNQHQEIHTNYVSPLTNHSMDDHMVNQKTKINKKFDKKKSKCFRCGRYGHLKADCYAKTHENGNKLL